MARVLHGEIFEAEPDLEGATGQRGCGQWDRRSARRCHDFEII